MKLGLLENNNTFKGVYNSKILKKGLEFAADNGALFGAATTLALSSAARPLAILMTPDTDKENKKAAAAKSIASGVIGFFVTMLATKPVAKAVDKIAMNPENFISQKAIKNLSDSTGEIAKSKTFQAAAQTIKLGTGLLVSAPKAMLTAAVTPFVIEKLFDKEDKKQKENKKTGAQISFTGANAQKIVSKVFENENFQSLSKKIEKTNFPLLIMGASDCLATGAFILKTKKSKKIKEERKKPLVINSVISTGLCIASTYFVDKLLDVPAKKFLENFKAANKNSPKLNKYVSGFNIAKPFLIAGALYYTLIPTVATYLADKIAGKSDKSKK